MGGCGIAVPTGLGKVNIATWIVPNGDAIRGCCRLATAGWRASKAPRSWNAILSGSNVSTAAPMAIDTAPLRRRRQRHTAPFSLHPTPECPATALPPAGDNATDFLWSD